MDMVDRISEANRRLKAAKIRVHIFRKGERLYFRATLPSKTTTGTGRYDLSTGCSATPAGLRRAEAIAKKLGAELECQEFSWGNWGNSPSSREISGGPTLGELWEQYAQFKKPQISPSTYAKDFTRQRNHLKRFPSQALEDASLIRDYLLHFLEPDAAKRCLMNLNACCKWAEEEGLIEVNPFLNMKIRVPKGLSEDEDVNPFTKAERDLIIETFANHRYYRHYTNYIRFLFFTGARPSEAIALQRRHIDKKLVKFRQSVVVSEHGLIRKEGLKNQRKRDFPVTPEVRAIFDNMQAWTYAPDAPLFPSPKGKFIDQHNFANRAWKKVLAQCGVPYRKCYQTRHTFISLCVEAHISSIAIARWVGTSAAMIDKHYSATFFANIEPPSLS
jgi:integrase